MKKIPFKIKFVPPKLDLRQYQQKVSFPSSESKRQMIIRVMEQLIDHTEKTIQQSTSEEKKKHQFRLSQFKKAIGSLRAYSGEITSGQQAKELPGIGNGIARRIDEILETGTLSELQEQKQISPTDQLIQVLTSVSGIGESHAQKFIEMGVTSLEDLKDKALKGQIKITHHMEIGLKYYHDFQQRIPHQEISDLEQMTKEHISRVFPDIILEICGSYRRQRPDSGDLDVLITTTKIVTDDDLIMSEMHYLKEIVKLLKNVGVIIDDLTSQGDTKYMGVCRHPHKAIGRRIDIRFIPYGSFYPALLYFTGSMMFNKLMRTAALEKGYTLNEYGLYRLVNGQKMENIMVHSEKEVFDLLNLVYLQPNEREIT
ncbi:MAG: nucleotidyltransferase domain-containing protein [candidate division WOR-3 bacterium]